MLSLRFQLKNSFGRKLFVPANKAATAMLTVAKQKTLTSEQIEVLKNAGFEIELVKIERK